MFSGSRPLRGTLQNNEVESYSYGCIHFLCNGRSIAPGNVLLALAAPHFHHHVLFVQAGDMDRAEQYVAAMEEEGIGAGNGVGDALVVYGALMQGYASIPAIFLCIQVATNHHFSTCYFSYYHRQ